MAQALIHFAAALIALPICASAPECRAAPIDPLVLSSTDGPVAADYGPALESGEPMIRALAIADAQRDDPGTSDFAAAWRLGVLLDEIEQEIAMLWDPRLLGVLAWFCVLAVLLRSPKSASRTGTDERH
ncbi:MAG: hypothetical protein ACLP8A_12005 [Methylovirgula sp.]